MNITRSISAGSIIAGMLLSSPAFAATAPQVACKGKSGAEYRQCISDELKALATAKAPNAVSNGYMECKDMQGRDKRECMLKIRQERRQERAEAGRTLRSFRIDVIKKGETGTKGDRLITPKQSQDIRTRLRWCKQYGSSNVTEFAACVRKVHQ